MFIAMTPVLAKEMPTGPRKEHGNEYEPSPLDDEPGTAAQKAETALVGAYSRVVPDESEPCEDHCVPVSMAA